MVSVIGAPKGFLRVEAWAVEPRGGTGLFELPGATAYLPSSSFLRVGLASAILVGPVAGAVVTGGGGVPFGASVFIVSLFSLSCLSLSNFSVFSSTGLAVLLAADFTGSFETGLVVVAAGGGIF